MFKRIKKRINPYPRPLGAEEKALRIDPEIPLCVGPRDYCKVVRVNSTFLEIVDAGFAARGNGLGAGVALSPFFFALIIASLLLFPKILFEPSISLSIRFLASGFLGSLFIGSVFMIWLLVWDLRHSIGKFTVYPIRIHRKKRKVYVLRKDGAADAYNWDALHFSFTRHSFHTGTFRVALWGVGVHALDESGESVTGGFTMPILSEMDPVLPASFWEFVRQYVESGPEHLPEIAYFLPTDPKMDTLALATYSAKPPWGGGVHSREHWQPSLLGRWILQMVCRPPKWPSEVEEECSYDADDPYARDAVGQKPFTYAMLRDMDKADRLFYEHRIHSAGVMKELDRLYGKDAFK